jgi:arylsulfatase A-like enzyme
MKHWWRTEPEQIREEDLRLAKACYRSLIHELDQHIGSLMAGLAKRDLLDNTIIVVTSDHGEHFGEHGLYCHGNSLYRSLVHVPLMVSWPQKIENRTRVSDPVTLRDLPATVLELTGIENNGRLGGISLAGLCTSDGQWQGRGASPLFALVNRNPNSDRSPHHRSSPVAKGSIYSLLEDGKYLIRYSDDERGLYDFLTDVAEERNLATDAAHQVQLQRIEGSLNRQLTGKIGAEGLVKGPDDRRQG